MGLLDMGASGAADNARSRFYGEAVPDSTGGVNAQTGETGVVGSGGVDGGAGDGVSSTGHGADGSDAGVTGAGTGQAGDGQSGAGSGDGSQGERDGGAGGGDGNGADVVGAGTGAGTGSVDAAQTKEAFIEAAFNRLAAQNGIDDLNTLTERERKLLTQNANQLWVIEEAKRAEQERQASAQVGDGADGASTDDELAQFQTEYERTLYGDAGEGGDGNSGNTAGAGTDANTQQPKQFVAPEGTARVLDLLHGLPGHETPDERFVLPVSFKDGRDYLAQLDAAAKANDIDTYLALQDAAALERHHNTRPIREAEFKAWLKQELGDILPALKTQHTQRAQAAAVNSSFDQAVNDLANAANSPMADIKSLFVAADDAAPLTINGRKYPPTPFNRAIAAHPEWMEIKKLGSDGKVDWRLTHTTVLRLAYQHHAKNGGAKASTGTNGSGATSTAGNSGGGQQQQTSQAVLDAARTAGVNAGREQVRQEARAGLNGGSGATAGGAQTQAPSYGQQLREGSATRRVRL